MYSIPLTSKAIERALPAAPHRRHAILLAAERRFGDRGFQGVPMRDSGVEAGVPVVLVSYHYCSKQ